MALLRKLVNSIDRFTAISGSVLAWCTLLMALITTTVVILRYGFSTGAIALQESITYLHGSLFMPDEYVVDIGFGQFIVDIDNGSARISENALNTFFFQYFH